MQRQLKWVAEYHDGTLIQQYEGDVKKSSDVIDRIKLKEFRLVNDNDEVVFRARFNNEDVNKIRKLIFRERVEISGLTGEVRGKVYLVGWHRNVKGVSVKSICKIQEDGSVDFGDLTEDEDIQLVPCEE